jgi:hypothetical protein
MKITLEMPQVARCTAAQCAYNVNALCHAKAITVGHGAVPACDTFLPGAAHAMSVKVLAGVGACKVTACRHNNDLECSLARIEVGVEGKETRCLSYAARKA